MKGGNRIVHAQGTAFIQLWVRGFRFCLVGWGVAMKDACWIRLPTFRQCGHGVVPGAWDGAPPPPRPGSMVGHTGPSSVIGSNEGLAALSAVGGCRKGKVQGQFPSQEYVGIQFAACIQEPGVADSPVLFEEADGEPSGPRLRAAPFRSVGRVAP